MGKKNKIAACLVARKGVPIYTSRVVGLVLQLR
jgi:hypothetical protein